MVFLRIGTKSSSSYVKATKQFHLRFLSPLIEMRKISDNFLNSISIGILDMIC